MPSKTALRRKFDKWLFVVRRPGDDDPAAIVEDIYGDRIDAANSVETLCQGAYEFVPTASGRIDPDGSNRMSTEWAIGLEPDADVRHTDVIVERADKDDPDSAVLHRFELSVVDLVTSFSGVPSHWEIRAKEYT